MAGAATSGNGNKGEMEHGTHTLGMVLIGAACDFTLVGMCFKKSIQDRIFRTIIKDENE